MHLQSVSHAEYAGESGDTDDAHYVGEYLILMPVNNLISLMPTSRNIAGNVH